MSYNKKNWKTGDIVTQEDINNIENGIYEAHTDISNINNALGSVTLNTTDKTLKGAINELFQNVSNGKELIASAITDKGVITSKTDTFQQMANNIRSIAIVEPGETTYTITKNLSNCSSDNNINSVTEGSSYTTVITANDSTTMNSISVLMNGVDVTNEYATPIYGELTYTITKNLSNCSSSNTSTSITEGSSYTTSITANDGYVLSSIIVVMGGYDITSSVVNRNNINISNVTGNIVITVKAESSGFTFTKYKRLNDGVLVDYTDESEATYHATVAMNPVEPASNYTIDVNSCNYICVCYYDEYKNYISYSEAHTDDWSVKQLSTTIRIPSNIKYIRVCATNSGAQVIGVLTEIINGGGTTI